MSRGASPATAFWHSHGDCIAGKLARRESRSPIAYPHQQRDTPTAYQNGLPISLAAECGGGAACRPRLFFGLCGPATFFNSVHGQRPAGVLKDLSLSRPANTAVPSPQAVFFKLSREGLGDSVRPASMMAERAIYCRKMDRRREALGMLPSTVDEGVCHLKRGRFSRTCFDTCVILVRSTGPERQ